MSPQNGLNVGVFSVCPCSGTLLTGSQQLVSVDCVAEQLGSWSQGLIIDIFGRDPSDHPEGIPFTLMAEICKPSRLHPLSDDSECVCWRQSGTCVVFQASWRT